MTALPNLAAVRKAAEEADKAAAIADTDKSPRGKSSISTSLVKIAQELYTFGSSTLGEAFAIPRRGPRIVSTLRGGRSSLRALLAHQYFRLHGHAAPQQALADALLVVEGIAQERDPVELHQRVARHDDHALYLDLGDRTGRAVVIRPGAWTVEDHAPMLFRRTALTAALPEPKRGGTLTDLWAALNVEPTDRPLVLAWLVATLIEGIPHPVLSLQGEQGTAKTTALRTLVSLIDPSPAPTRKPPRDPDGWVTAAAGSWIVGVDNLSSVPDWLSDSICRAVTGDGDVRRKLYTDGEHAVFAFRRAVAITSIDLGALRGDLAERMLPVTLHVIDESRRLRDAEVQAAWSRAHPAVLGALLDLAADVLQRLPGVQLPAMPRMADYAEILAAVDLVTGTGGLRDYLGRQREMASDTLASDPLILAIMEVGGIVGTASGIYQRLTPEGPLRDWPTNARAVTQRLRRHSPALRRTGWHVTSHVTHGGALQWTVRRPGHVDVPDTTSPQSPLSPSASRGDCGDEGDITSRPTTCPHCDGEGCPWCMSVGHREPT